MALRYGCAMTAGTEATSIPYWTQPLHDLHAELGADAAGLTGTEAELRRVHFGPNVLKPKGQRALVLEFLTRFNNPLVLLLLAAAAVAGFTGDPSSFIIILITVLASVTLDFVQEYRAGRAAEHLRLAVAVRVTVIRDGQTQQIAVADIVPGDIACLSAGDLVPADGRVLEARDFFVNQALLTGEAYPVEKSAAALAEPVTDPAAASNAVLMGTSVVSGSARMLICRTGARTGLGAISATLNHRAPPTAFERGTRQFGLFIMRLTLLLALFVLLVNTFFHRPWLETFLFAMALAVGLTPELLPMVISVTLARGATRMADKKVIVKRLAAIHDLGSMDILCTDKTGTLTEARIRLERHVDCRGRDSGRVLELAYINSYFETGLKSPLDTAILEHEDIDVRRWHKIDEVPFGFERRRVSVLVDDGRERLLAVKGAPEDILKLCTHYECESPGDLRPWDTQAQQGVEKLFADLAREGFRVLAIAWRTVPQSHGHAVVDDETELTFAGLAAFLDPPKASAAHALADLKGSGVTVKVLTGDNELVTQHIFAELGVQVEGVLTGAEIAQLDEPALEVRALQANLFCRLTPAQKSRVILALKRRGHVVGFLGDGINDAPAMHGADVSVSVDGAVDVAKDAADMILMEHDLNVLHDGVLEGRRTFGNIMKYIMMATSSNFGNMFSMAGAVLFLPFLPMLPIQILLNNLLYDASEIPIPMDTVDREYLTQPRFWDMGFVRDFMLVVGPVSSFFDFLTFYLLLKVFDAGEALFQTGWFIESLATQILVIFVIRTRLRPWRSRPHPWLTGASLAVVFVAVALPYTPLGRFFGFVPPPWHFLLVLALLSSAYLVCVEWVKHGFYQRRAHHPV